MHQLRRFKHTAVAPRYRGQLPVQRVRPVSQIKRRQPADCQAHADPCGNIQNGGHCVRQLFDHHDHPMAENARRRGGVQCLRVVPEGARPTAPHHAQKGEPADPQTQTTAAESGPRCRCRSSG